MKNLPLVTIGIAAYNHQEYVGYTIESVLNQNYKNIELIIINDGSTDNTDKEISKYIDICERTFPSFKYINRQNKGFVPTLNEILDVSKGDYIYMLASDDILKPEMVSKCVEFFEKKPEVEVLIFDIDLIDENNSIIKSNESGIIGFGKKFKNLSYINLKRLLEFNYFYGPSIFIKKSVFEKIGKYDENIGFEDWDFMIRVLMENIKIDYLQESLVLYRIHQRNMNKNLIYMLENTLTLLEKYKEIPDHNHRVINIFYQYLKYRFSKKELSVVKNLFREYYRFSFEDLRNPKVLVKLLIVYLKLIKRGG